MPTISCSIPCLDGTTRLFELKYGAIDGTVYRDIPHGDLFCHGSPGYYNPYMINTELQVGSRSVPYPFTNLKFGMGTSPGMRVTHLEVQL